MDEQKDMPGPAHLPGTRKGEQMKDNEGQEPGRHDAERGRGSGSGRPAGTSSARHSTSISPEAEEPIDPSSPHMPPP